MPEVRFSRQTVFAAVQVIGYGTRTHGDFDRCLLEWGPDIRSRCRGRYLQERFNALMGLYDEQPLRCIDGGKLFADAIVEKAVSYLPSAQAAFSWHEPPPLSDDQSALLHALDRDGFAVTDGLLRRTLPTAVNLPEAEDEIVRLLNKHRFAVANGHLEQAFANHSSGQWAAANSQIRSFLDSLLDEIAEKINPSVAGMPSGQPRRTQLAAQGFLSRPLNEWDDNGLGFINGLVKRLHPHGSHPGLSDQDDSTFRLHTVLLTARLLLARFDSRGTS